MASDGYRVPSSGPPWALLQTLPESGEILTGQRKILWEIHVKYKVALHESEEGFSVCAPGLPGCWSQGKTESEALANIEAAIQEYLGVVEELLEDAQIREIEVPG